MLLAAACGDGGPESGPGTLTATVLSPNGAEGAAVVEVFGPGIGAVGALEGRVFSERRGDTVRVVMVRDGDAGDLRFTLSVADTTEFFGGTVLEVAGPDDALRAGVSSYTLEVRR
jgi:hypothetical protein